MRKRKKVERIKVPKNAEEYMKWRIQKGYENKDGNPMKCENCGCRKFKRTNEDYINYWGGLALGEYDVECKCCGSIEGHWAYGYYQAIGIY